MNYAGIGSGNRCLVNLPDRILGTTCPYRFTIGGRGLCLKGVTQFPQHSPLHGSLASAFSSAAVSGLGSRPIEEDFADADEVASSGLMARALLLSPRDPMHARYLINRGCVYIVARNKDLAVSWCWRALKVNPNCATTHRLMAAAHALAGRRGIVTCRD